MKFNVKNIVFLVLLVVCFLIGATVLSTNMTQNAPVTYGDVISLLEEGKVYSLEIDSSLNTTLELYTYEEGSTEPVQKDGKFVTETVIFRLGYGTQLESIEARALASLKEEGGLVVYNYEQ
ncbi:MAG: hypothetical protein J6R89_03050, partial [Clostridia bacterium]|nr:hypothetical protein [Clostridia bacterium]